MSATIENSRIRMRNTSRNQSANVIVVISNQPDDLLKSILKNSEGILRSNSIVAPQGIVAAKADTYRLEQLR